MSLQSAGGGDYSTLVINTLINRTQNITYADTSPQTTFQGTVTIPNLRITESITNTPGPITVSGDVNVNGVLGANKGMKGLIVGNRDFEKCYPNGAGLPGEDPNAGQITNELWGNTTMYSRLLIDRKPNPGDFWNQFGAGLEVISSDTLPHYNDFGGPQAALTSFQVGNNGTEATAEFAQVFYYYGAGHFRNKISMDSSDNIFSATPSLVMTLPTRQLINTPNVLPTTSITASGNIGTIAQVNPFNVDSLGCGTPIPGMTITINAEPTTLNVTSAVILSVTLGVDKRYALTYVYPTSLPPTTSTKVNYVYLGPGIVGDNTTATVYFPTGPIPLVGQKISVVAQPINFNVTDALITSVVLGGPGLTPYSTLTYEYTDPITASASSIVSVTLRPGTQGTNTSYGTLGNMGIHTLVPSCPLDITGDIQVRSATTDKFLFHTETVPDPSPSCHFYFNDPFDLVSPTPSTFIDYDLANQTVTYRSRVAESDMMQIDCLNGRMYYKNPDTTAFMEISCLDAPSALTCFQDDGTTVLFKVDQDTNTVTVGTGVTFVAPPLPPVVPMVLDGLFQTLQSDHSTVMLESQPIGNSVTVRANVFNIRSTTAIYTDSTVRFIWNKPAGLMEVYNDLGALVGRLQSYEWRFLHSSTGDEFFVINMFNQMIYVRDAANQPVFAAAHTGNVSIGQWPTANKFDVLGNSNMTGDLTVTGTTTLGSVPVLPTGYKLPVCYSATFNQAALLSLDPALPLQILPSPGAGKTIHVISTTFSYTYDSAAFTITGGGLMFINYGGLANGVTPLVTMSTFFSGVTADWAGYLALNSPTYTTPATEIVDQPLVFQLDAGTVTGGGSSSVLTLNVTYIVI